jgi:sulfur carrier protein
MNVFLNGESCELRDGATVTDAVEASGAPPGGRGVAVAIDGVVVPRGEWKDTQLSDGQRIEVLQAVQGG